MSDYIEKFIIDGVEYPLIIKYKKIKNIKIRVSASNIIEVSIHSYIEKNKVYEVLNNYIDWLKKMILFNNKNNYHLELNELLSKKKMLLLGKNRIVIYDKNLLEKYYFSDDVYIKNENWTYKEVFLYLKNHLVDLYNTKTFDLKNKPKLIIKPLKSRWGSYNRQKNEITLNLFLLFFDEALIKYVIDHEICHIKYFDHSSMFYKELEKNCPNYLLYRMQMKKYTPIIREIATL